MDDSGNLKELYELLQKELSINDKKEFHPHVTLGRFDDNATMTSVQKTINWKAFEFTLTGLHLIVRNF